MKAFLSSVFLLLAASASVRAFESPEHDVATIEESEEMTLFGDLEEFTQTFEEKSDKSKSKSDKSKSKDEKEKKSSSKSKKSKDDKDKSSSSSSKSKKSKDKKKKSSSSSSKSKRYNKNRSMCDCDMKNKDRDFCEDVAKDFNCYHGSQDDREEDMCEWLGIYDRDSCSSLDGYADGYADKSASLRGYVEIN